MELHFDGLHWTALSVLQIYISPSLWSLIVYLNSAYSFQPMTRSHLWNSQSSSFSMSSLSIEFPLTSPLIEAQSSSLTFSAPLVRPLRSNFISPPAIIWKAMARPSKWIKPSNSTSESTVTISKTIGRNSCPSLSSLTITLRVLPLNCHHFLLIKVTIQTSQFIWNATSTLFISSSMKRWLMPKSVIKGQLILDDLWHRTSKSVIRPSLKPSISGLLLKETLWEEFRAVYGYRSSRLLLLHSLTPWLYEVHSPSDLHQPSLMQGSWFHIDNWPEFCDFTTFPWSKGLAI